MKNRDLMRGGQQELRTGIASHFSPGLAALPHFQTMHLGASRGAVTLRGHGSAPARASGAGPRPAWARSDSSEGLRASWCGSREKWGRGRGRVTQELSTFLWK
jgi:hypothetical protein